jgi:formylglycine-generating enzyme required for sulfatase activity
VRQVSRALSRLLAGLVGAVLAGAAAGAAADRLPVGPAELDSVLPTGAARQPVHVARFGLDRLPVTNGQFLAFVRAHPSWQRGRVPALFADGDYLSHWQGPDELGGAALPDQPVTRVSWYAARAYCESVGGRLPEWKEWELAAAASERLADARKDPAWRARILDWYSQPADRVLARVGQGPADANGIQDLHGLVWEWVEDFNALIVSGDSRDQGDADKLRFCGAGALSLEDKDNFAILMRIAFLSALQADSSARSLGFRCAARADDKGDAP